MKDIQNKSMAAQSVSLLERIEALEKENKALKENLIQLEELLQENDNLMY